MYAYGYPDLEGPVSCPSYTIQHSTVAGCQYINSFASSHDFRVYFYTLENNATDNELRENVICNEPTDRTYGEM